MLLPLGNVALPHTKPVVNDLFKECTSNSEGKHTVHLVH